MFVLDSSVALAWCFISERTPATARMLDQVSDRGACVPDLWHLEVSNVLLLSQRKGRITTAEMQESLALLETLPISCDDETRQHAFAQTLSLAQTHQLTTYDAAYLELAIRRRLPLATLDAALQRAALASGVTLALQNS